MTELTIITRAAEQLATATRAGDLSGAYQVLQAHPYDAISEIALRAGFPVVATRNRREFMTFLSHQVAEAARKRTDGWGLRPRENSTGKPETGA